MAESIFSITLSSDDQQKLLDLFTEYFSLTGSSTTQISTFMSEVEAIYENYGLTADEIDSQVSQAQNALNAYFQQEDISQTTAQEAITFLTNAIKILNSEASTSSTTATSTTSSTTNFFTIDTDFTPEIVIGAFMGVLSILPDMGLATATFEVIYGAVATSLYSALGGNSALSGYATDYVIEDLYLISKSEYDSIGTTITDIMTEHSADTSYVDQVSSLWTTVYDSAADILYQKCLTASLDESTVGLHIDAMLVKIEENSGISSSDFTTFKNEMDEFQNITMSGSTITGAQWQEYCELAIGQLDSFGVSQTNLDSIKTEMSEFFSEFYSWSQIENLFSSILIILDTILGVGLAPIGIEIVIGICAVISFF